MIEYYMCTVWNDEIIKLPVQQENSKSIRLVNGTVISKYYSTTQFVGKTKEEAKRKYLCKLQEDLNAKMITINKIEERIDKVKSW